MKRKGLMLCFISLLIMLFSGMTMGAYHHTGEADSPNFVAAYPGCEGTKLDSWGDMAIYLTAPLCAWWLWPQTIKREAFFVFLVLAAYLVPILAGFVKFGRIPTYHTWAAKMAAVLMGVAFFALFMFDVTRPFHCAAAIQALVACEEVAITLRLSETRSNVSSYWHVEH